MLRMWVFTQTLEKEMFCDWYVTTGYHFLEPSCKKQWADHCLYSYPRLVWRILMRKSEKIFSLIFARLSHKDLVAFRESLYSKVKKKELPFYILSTDIPLFLVCERLTREVDHVSLMRGKHSEWKDVSLIAIIHYKTNKSMDL